MTVPSEGRPETLVDRALGRDPNAPIDLRRKPRIFESAIQYFLFACGFLSVMTTLGIVLVLLSQSLTFFSRVTFEPTNRSLVQAAAPDDTILRVSATGGPLDEASVVRISNERMNVIEFLPNAIDIEETGTGGGFRNFFCLGETDINNASRPISDEERALCEENGVNPLEFQVGTDAIAVVVNSANEFATELTTEEVQLVFSEAELWSDVRADWPAEPIMRFIPGEDSGTYDFFAETFFEDDSSALLALDPVTSEDDDQLERNIRTNEFGVGFFGYSYYINNADDLNVVTIDGVEPNRETVDDTSYLLSRPLFIYVNEQSLLERDEVAAFVNFYLTNVDDVIEDVGYFPEPQEDLDAAQQSLSDLIAEGGALPEVDFSDIHGDIAVAGSSTVFPLTRRIANDFRDAGFLPELEVERGSDPQFPAVAHSVGTEVERGEQATLVEFFTNTVWQPAIFEFGIFPLIYGTLITSIIAMLVALPLGLGAAIYLSEYAPTNVRSTLKPILEILAGIPTVVYGYFALTFMTPLLRSIFGQEVVQIFNSASAGIVVGILIIPLVSSMSEDALRAVPRALREASYGLGANKQETTLKVVLPAALSGIVAAFIVAISRAIGETMIVAIAAGSGPLNNIGEVFGQRGLGIVFVSAETMTGHIARISGGDLSYDSIDYNSIFAIGLTLFVITFILNIISRVIINRFREAY